MEKTNLFGMSLDELFLLFDLFGEKKFRAKQVLPWLYQKQVVDIDQMTNLSLELRHALKEVAEIRMFKGTKTFKSIDGSVKYLFTCDDGKELESVYMPMRTGNTLCISSQVGCAQACSFCMTATMGFIRNLSPGEILAQVASIVQDQQLESPFNIVMMGMGEPLLNIRNLEKSLAILFSPIGFDLSPKRVIVSTSGHVTNMKRLAGLPKRPRLAVSLNATTDEQRNEIMPVNQQWPIADLLQACRDFPLGSRDRITFEYVVMRGFNDTRADAKRLVKLLEGIQSKVNLIPFNETPELPYREPEVETLNMFQEILNRSGLRNTIRWSKGRDIGAACGQLVVETEKGKHRKSS